MECVVYVKSNAHKSDNRNAFFDKSYFPTLHDTFLVRRWLVWIVFSISTVCEVPILKVPLLKVILAFVGRFRSTADTNSPGSKFIRSFFHTFSYTLDYFYILSRLLPAWKLYTSSSTDRHIYDLVLAFERLTHCAYIFFWVLKVLSFFFPCKSALSQSFSYICPVLST